jgi:hypothetical protein
MTGQREEIDDTIDRVAAAITFVPADPAFAARIAERLGSEPALAGLAWPRLAAGIAVVALVVAAIAVSREKPAERLVGTVPPATVDASPPGVEPAQADPPVAPSNVNTRARPALRGAPASRAADDVSGVPQIAALNLPEPLDVADLPTDSLTIAPVELAPLELASLAVAELDTRDDFKE